MTDLKKAPIQTARKAEQIEDEPESEKSSQQE